MSILTLDVNGNVIATGDAIPVTSDQFSSHFSRIKERRFLDTEEVRYDIPASLPNAAIYVGVAPAVSAVTAAVWSVVRTDFDGNGNPQRDRIRKNVQWDLRTVGW